MTPVSLRSMCSRVPLIGKLQIFFASGVAGLSFANGCHNLHAVGTNGKFRNIFSKTRSIEEFKASKESISTLAFSRDGKHLAVARGSRLRVIDLERGRVMIKLSKDLGQVQRVSLSDEANTLVTLASKGKDLQVRTLEKEYWNSWNSSRGIVLSMNNVRTDCTENLEQSFWQFRNIVPLYGI